MKTLTKFLCKTIVSFFLSFGIGIGFFSCTPTAEHSKPVSLAGQWKFKLDPQGTGIHEEWFRTRLPNKIDLPGSCEQGGYGMKFTEAAVGKLTRIIKYEGKAWYQKEIVIPSAWSDKRIELFLERCHWETNVWIDEKPYGMQNSLSTPHVYDLGSLSPGKHLLTICIDNTYKIPIGTWAHAITEDTQGNWNGIIGRIELNATDPIWIKGVQVFPASLKVNVGNQTGKDAEVELQSNKYRIPAGGAVVEIPFTEKENNWDEFSPVIRQLNVSLTSGKWKDSKAITYGNRSLKIKDKQFVLNGRPIMMRGPVDECIYPLTGYPPMDKESWLRVLRICHDYGFNFMRFHSWCPPAAAFEAGDELGFLFQVELPLWTMDAPHFGQHPVRDQFIRDELNLILETYGNHPSFAFMAMGNESAGTLDELTRFGREKDSRRLYRCETGNTEETGDFFEIGQRGTIGPRTDWDRWSASTGWIAGTENTNRNTGAPVPTFAHEVGQWSMYPDLNEVSKYKGTLKALNFEAYKKSLETHNMSDLAYSFFKSSGKLSVLLYKDEIEASLRTFPYGGFQILEARDYPGQGTAIVGWLDAFWDSKGLITPDEFRRFCSPTVCLMRMPKRVLLANESFKAQAEIAHYGPAAIRVSPEWKITETNGSEIASGNLPAIQIKTGRITKLGEINVPLTNVPSSKKILVTLSAAGTSNSWEIWVYPDVKTQIPKNIRIAYAFDKFTKNALAKGERVLLFSSPEEGIIAFHKGMVLPDSLRFLPEAQPGRNALPGSFMPVFWCTRLFNQIGTMGILCDPGHPAFEGFPTEEHSNWQWADLLGHFTAANSFRVAGAPEEMALEMERTASDVCHRSKAILLDETPSEFRPILQVIDNYDRNAKLGTIFEVKAGNGKLLVCAMDLETDAANRPAARQLMQSLMNYVAGEKFMPKDEFSFELLEKLLATKATH